MSTKVSLKTNENWHKEKLCKTLKHCFNDEQTLVVKESKDIKGFLVEKILSI